MSSKFGLFITELACAFALHAEENPVAVSEAFEASLDTIEYGAHSVTSIESPVEIYGFKGAAIVARNIDSGVTETVVADADMAGYIDWTPSAGGIWELSNTQDGTVRFTVRYSLFGNAGQGDGSAENPVKIVDFTEVKDLAENETNKEFKGFTVIEYCWKALDEYKDELNVQKELSLFLPLIAVILIILAVITSIRLGLSAIRKLDFDNDATSF